jgi:hypothetical protein
MVNPGSAIKNKIDSKTWYVQEISVDIKGDPIVWLSRKIDPFKYEKEYMKIVLHREHAINCFDFDQFESGFISLDDWELTGEE